MNKDVHKMDELFRSALEGHEESPSAGVKESLDEALDKQDAASFKKRFIGWKRAAILSLLLLAGFVLYEAFILKWGLGHSYKRTEIKNTTSSSGKKGKGIYQNPTSEKTNNNNLDSYNKKTTKKKSEDTNQEVTGVDNKLNNPRQKNSTVQLVLKNNNTIVPHKNYQANKIKEQRKAYVRKQLESFKVVAKTETPDIQPTIKKTLNKPLTKADPLPEEKNNLTNLSKTIGITKKAQLPVNTITSTQLPPINDSLLKSSTVKKQKIFKPFWMITGFASYDRAGYKLDSDEPNAISSIRYREAHEPSFSGGILLTRQLTSFWALQSGLTYSKIAIGMKPQKTYAFQDPTGDVAYKYITSSGYAFIKPGFGLQPVVGDSLTTAEAKHKIENIGVPLVVKYTVLNKRLSFIPGVGIEANLITRANLEVDIEDAFNREIVLVRKLNGTKSFYWSFVADADLRYHLNKKTSVNFRPAFKRSVSPITENNVVETFPYSFGMGLGMTLRF